MTVLQGGRRRRTHNSRHRLALGALAILLGIGALLIAMAGRASGPAVVTAAPKVKAMKPALAPRSGYGITPARVKVNVNLRLPLRSGLLFDVSTGEVLWQHDAQAVLPIASLTKMMTALVVVEHVSPNAQAMITSQAVHFSGSGVGLLPLGKRVSVLTLLYGLLLPSGNDAAIALAQRVAGSVDRFIALMNARAREMGLRCTHFTTVSGIVDQGNYSCPADLALMAHAVLTQPVLARIVGSSSAVEPLPIKGGKLWLYNNNPLYALHYAGTDGVKTGLTTASGHCLVATVKRGRVWLGVVLLHATNSGPQAETIFNAGFAQAGA